MRRFAITLTAIALALGVAQVGATEGDEAAAIIDKAIKAHGVKGKEDKPYAYLGKNKGTLHIAGMDLEFTQQIKTQTPDKFKEVVNLNIGGTDITVTTGFDGKKGWIDVSGMEIEVTKEILAEFNEIAHMMRLSQAMFLKDKALKFSLLGEVKVSGKAAVGIKVSKKGQKDIDFYFDKATGLLAKIERRAFDMQSMQEVTEERIIVEYKDLDGRKVAKKVEIKRDGMAYLEAEVIEAQIVDRIDDSEFTKPG